jgi:uncharacterized protein (UPF0210 family)
MHLSLIALALSASALAAPVARRQVGDILDTSITGTQEGLDSVSSQVKGITGQLLDTDNPDSALSTLNDNTVENTKDVLDTLLGRRQDTNAVGDILDTSITGTQEGLDSVSSQVKGITGQLLDTDNPDSALSTLNDNTVENTKDVLADLGLGGS